MIPELLGQGPGVGTSPWGGPLARSPEEALEGGGEAGGPGIAKAVHIEAEARVSLLLGRPPNLGGGRLGSQDPNEFPILHDVQAIGGRQAP